MQTDHEASELAVVELAAVLHELGIRGDVVSGAHGRAELRLPGGLLLAVEAASRPSVQRLHRLGLLEGRPAHIVPVLVADQLDPGTRKALKDAGWGWLERTGHLRLIAGPVQIDRPVPSLVGPDPAPPRPLARPSGLAVALELLREGERGSLRDVAKRADVSVGAAHSAIKDLEGIGLLEGARRRDPDLFWAVAEHWRVQWFPLASGPFPGIPQPTRRLLRMRFDEPEAPGWAEVGDVAAQAYGARVAGDAPPRLYLPDQRALTWALRTWGQARDEGSATALLAVTPAANAARFRVEHPAMREWLFGQPLVVALNLASDGSSRSREILKSWDPTHAGFDHVW